MTELLRRTAGTEIRREVLPLAASGIALGFFACRMTDQLFTPQFSMASRVIPDAITMGLLLATVSVRFWNK